MSNRRPRPCRIGQPVGSQTTLHHCTSSTFVTEAIGTHEGREIKLRLSMRADDEGWSVTMPDEHLA